MSFTAVIKEISQYPDSDGASYMSDSQNSNASYYPFYALIEDTEDITEGDSATLQLSGDAINDPDKKVFQINRIRVIDRVSGELQRRTVTLGNILGYPRSAHKTDNRRHCCSENRSCSSRRPNPDICEISLITAVKLMPLSVCPEIVSPT